MPYSLGGFICLKVLEQLPQIKKGFALSTANYYGNLNAFPDEKILLDYIEKNAVYFPNYISLNAATLDIFMAAYKNLAYFNLLTDVKALKGKQIIILDEDPKNKNLAEAIKASDLNFFDYQVWDTDHGFTNKRVSLANLVLSFLDK